MSKLSRQFSLNLGSFVSPVIDGLTLALYIFFLPWLAASYLTPSWINGSIIGFAFIMLLISISCLKGIAASKNNQVNTNSVSAKRSSVKSKTRKHNDDCCFSPAFYTMACAFIYCGFLALVFIQTATTYDLNTDSAETAGAWLMFISAMAVLLVIVIPPFGEAKANTQTGYILHAISVIGVSLVTIVGMAYWESIKLADPGGAPEPAQGFAKLFLFLLLLLVFTGFIGLPRIYLHLIKGDRLGLVTYIASLGYYVWDLFEY